jgi:hypothetical protein
MYHLTGGELDWHVPASLHGGETFVNAYQGASTTVIAEEFNRQGTPDNSVLMKSRLSRAQAPGLVLEHLDFLSKRY